MKKNAFTLIELLVAMSILTLLLVGFYHAFAVGILAYIKEEKVDKNTQNARLVLKQMAHDFQNALITSEFEIEGDSKTINFYLLADSDSLQKVRYILNEKTNTLLRETIPWPHTLFKKNITESREMTLPLSDFSIQYFQKKPIEKRGSFLFKKNEDLFEWIDSWEKGIPLGIQVKLSYGEQIFNRTILSPYHYNSLDIVEPPTVTIQNEHNER